MSKSLARLLVETLTFVAAMAREPKRIKGGFRYAYEDVSIG